MSRPESRTAASLDEIRRAGERARDLVDQILTFGRAGARQAGTGPCPSPDRGDGIDVQCLASRASGEVEVRIRETPQEMVVLARAGPVAAGIPQPLQQRRTGDGGNRNHRNRSGCPCIENRVPARAGRTRPRPIHVGFDKRHRAWHGRSHAGAHLRAVLHDPAGRKRAGPCDGAPDRPGTRRSHRRYEVLPAREPASRFCCPAPHRLETRPGTSRTVPPSPRRGMATVRRF